MVQVYRIGDSISCIDTHVSKEDWSYDRSIPRLDLISRVYTDCLGSTVLVLRVVDDVIMTRR